MSLQEWLAVLVVALPLFGKVLADISVNASTKHNDALARITGMASRSAAEIALALAALPPGTNPAAEKTALIANARNRIMSEMQDSLKVTGAGDAQVTTILTGEVAKVLAPAVMPILTIDRIPPSPLPVGPLAPRGVA